MTKKLHLGVWQFVQGTHCFHICQCDWSCYHAVLQDFSLSKETPIRCCLLESC